MLIRRHNSTDNLHFVHKALWKQGTDRTIDQTRRQCLFFTRTGFTLKEATGYSTYSIGFFLIMNCQREEIAAWSLGFFRNHGAQHRSVLNGHQDGSTRLPSNTTSLQSDSLATVLECFSYWIHFNSPILKMTPGRSHERPGKGVAYLRRPSRLIRSL